MFLEVIKGPGQGRKFALNLEGKLIIGRGKDSDTNIEDETRALSRKHCEISINSGTILLRDLNSAGGTFVDGRKIDTVQITPGSKFEAGNSLFHLATEDSSEAKTIVGQNNPQKTDLKITDLVGQKLGPYELTEVIGKGTSGLVFKAIDSEKNRTAAVKVLFPEVTVNDDQRDRFVRAMKTMLPIRDAHIIELYNAGKNGPFCWAAMAYIDGINLADLIEKVGIDGMLDWQEVWRVAVHISRALRVAYDQQVIHRNVTPTNILRRDKDRKCLLGDFMLAKALEGQNAKQITQPGQLIGDLPYMAPERTLAEATVDTRSDIYGLGATCYALLTGKPPASGNSLPEIIKSIREVVPPLPKTIHLSVDELFQDIVMKMIAKDPADRFQTPKDLIGELQRIGKFNNLEADWSDWSG